MKEWIAVYTKPRHEKVVEKGLQEKNIDNNIHSNFQKVTNHSIEWEKIYREIITIEKGITFILTVKSCPISVVPYSC